MCDEKDKLRRAIEALGGGEEGTSAEDQYRERELSREELAYHEAAHFVFACMVCAHFAEFCPMDYVISCIDKPNEMFNRVSGFGPANIQKDLPYKPDGDEDAPCIKSFYEGDLLRVIAKLFVVLAGYTSYLVFIEENEFFVGVIDLENGNVSREKKDCSITIKYYQLKYVYCSNAQDFNESYKKLDNYYGIKGRDAFNAHKIIINHIKDLMSRQSVNDSIRYVKNRLLENECTKIEGKKLKEMIREVKRLTNRVDLRSELDKAIIDLLS